MVWIQCQLCYSVIILFQKIPLAAIRFADNIRDIYLFLTSVFRLWSTPRLGRLPHGKHYFHTVRNSSGTNIYYTFFARCAQNERTQRWPCLSVRMFQLDNRWMDSDENWYGYCATEGCHKLVRFNFLQPLISIWRKDELVMWQWHQSHFIYGPEIPHTNVVTELWKNIQIYYVFKAGIVIQNGSCMKSICSSWYDRYY
jgi:hypothetical protein